MILQLDVVIDTEGPAASVTFGDDVVSVATQTDGTVDDIKLELELLPAVGEVSKQRFVCCWQKAWAVLFSQESHALLLLT